MVDLEERGERTVSTLDKGRKDSPEKGDRRRKNSEGGRRSPDRRAKSPGIERPKFHFHSQTSEEKKRKKSSTMERREKDQKVDAADLPPVSEQPEIVRATKTSRFVERPEPVRASKPQKFVTKQLTPPKDVDKSKKKKKKKRKKKYSSSSSSSTYSYSSDEGKRKHYEDRGPSNRPPPPPRPPRADHSHHTYENHPPAKLSAEIVTDPIVVESPIFKRKSLDLIVPPSPSNSPLVKRKEVQEKKAVDVAPSKPKESSNPFFKFGNKSGKDSKPEKSKEAKPEKLKEPKPSKLSKEPEVTRSDPEIQPKSKEGKDRRVSVAASIFGDVVLKRRPPAYRQVEKPKTPLDEITTGSFTLKKTVEGPAINLERPVPGLGRVVGEDFTPPPSPRLPTRRSSAPPSIMTPEPPNILQQLTSGVKLRSVPRPDEKRIGLGRVVERDMPGIPTGGSNGYTRLLSDIKEMGGNVESVIDKVRDSVSSPPPTPPPAPKAGTNSSRGNRNSFSSGPTLLDELKNPGKRLRKVTPPKIKVHLVTETDHLDVPLPKPDKQMPRNVPLPRLIQTSVTVLNIPPAKLNTSSESHNISSDDENNNLLPRYLRSRPTSPTSPPPPDCSIAAKTSAIMSPIPLADPALFVDFHQYVDTGPISVSYLKVF
eukprot:sb/3462861/